MSSDRTNRVRIDVAGEMVEITWHERDVLLEELAWAPGMKAVRERFEAVDATRPVELTEGEQSDLREALDSWGSDSLQPDGIARLHSALGSAASEASDVDA
jgi:hypothetical protein